jgi:hypothetical protein
MIIAPSVALDSEQFLEIVFHRRHQKIALSPSGERVGRGDRDEPPAAVVFPSPRPSP